MSLSSTVKEGRRSETFSINRGSVESLRRLLLITRDTNETENLVGHRGAMSVVKDLIHLVRVVSRVCMSVYTLVVKRYHLF